MIIKLRIEIIEKQIRYLLNDKYIWNIKTEQS